jgi:hypothetical protein
MVQLVLLVSMVRLEQQVLLVQLVLLGLTVQLAQQD